MRAQTRPRLDSLRAPGSAERVALVRGPDVLGVDVGEVRALGPPVRDRQLGRAELGTQRGERDVVAARAHRRAADRGTLAEIDGALAADLSHLAGPTRPRERPRAYEALVRVLDGVVEDVLAGAADDRVVALESVLLVRVI